MLNLFLISCFVFIIPFSDATNCYRCAYVDGIKIEPESVPTAVSDEAYTLHYSCVTGKKPKDKFIINCENWFKSQKQKNTSISDNRNNLVSLVNGIPSSINMEDTPVTFACIKLNFEGRLVFSGAKAEITVRGCIPVYSSQEKLPDKCYDDIEKAHINDVIQEEAIKEWIHEDNFNEETTVDVCTCNSDECNGVTGSVSVNSLVFILTVFVQILYFL
ncbi:unnamed protein product [Orchesella dallaii]|uniref:Protein quiver n=1 Tax=Orchesella dallaii TaxID=48710 RepID=A0ABP1RIS9_9HEXA